MLKSSYSPPRRPRRRGIKPFARGLPPTIPQREWLLGLGVRQNADRTLETRARGGARAVVHSLEFHMYLRADSPPVQDDAVQRANARAVCPAQDERGKRAVAGYDFINRLQQSNAAVGARFSIKNLAGKITGSITAGEARHEKSARRGRAGYPFRERDFKAFMLVTLMVLRRSLQAKGQGRRDLEQKQDRAQDGGDAGPNANGFHRVPFG